MSFLERVLDAPSYGFERDGELYVPTTKQIWREFFRRLDPRSPRRNWLAIFTWSAHLSLLWPLYLFARHYFSWPLLVLGFLYSMVALGTHGTIWLHRYSTHRAYRFRNAFFRAVCRNLVIKLIPEETYVISHHVHHRVPDRAGDPYNPKAGFLYCFLADVIHQGVAKDLDREEYGRVCAMLKHTGLRMNDYEGYQKWGTVCRPASTIAHYALNWSFWYGAFFLLGGHALALAMFGSAAVWAFGVRTFNFGGHGSGEDRRQEGIDFNGDDLSINQLWPGYVAGEWHSNHHLYPGSARCGFLRYQVDFAWYFIWTGAKLGAIASYRDFKPDFERDHYLPYLAAREAALRAPAE